MKYISIKTTFLLSVTLFLSSCGSLQPAFELPTPQWPIMASDARHKGFGSAKISTGTFHSLKAKQGIGKTTSKENRSKIEQKTVQRYQVIWQADTDTLHFEGLRTSFQRLDKEKTYSLGSEDGKIKVTTETETSTVDSLSSHELTGHILLRADTVGTFRFKRKITPSFELVFEGGVMLKSGATWSLTYTRQPPPYLLLGMSVLLPIQQWHLNANGKALATWDIGKKGRKGTYYWNPDVSEEEKRLSTGFFALVFVGMEFFE